MRAGKQVYESEEHKKYSQEVDKQYILVYGAATIIFKEIYNWGDRRIKKIFDNSELVWQRIQMQGSMQNVMQICEQETGIIMDIKGRQYKDVDVFSYEWAERCKTQSQKDYIYSCSRPWVANGFIACLLIGLHNTERWGKRKRLPEFVEDIKWTMGEYHDKYEYSKILKDRYDIQFCIERC